MKFSWSHLFQVLFANAVPLLQKVVNQEKLVPQDYMSAVLDSVLGYVSISGSLPEASVQGDKVTSTIKALGNATNNVVVAATIDSPIGLR